MGEKVGTPEGLRRSWDLAQGRWEPTSGCRGAPPQGPWAARPEQQETDRAWGWPEDGVHAPAGDGDRPDTRWVRGGCEGQVLDTPGPRHRATSSHTDDGVNTSA